MRNVLAVLLMMLSTPSFSQSFFEETRFLHIANKPWTDSGVDISTDTQVYITATGSAEWASGFRVSPLGDPSLYLNHAKSVLVLPGAPQYSLICKVGKGPAFYVGTGISGRLNPEFPGRLRCTMNESTGTGAYTDNTGGFAVTILHAAVD